jgi:ketosteroid isomerase-like protein
MSEEAVEMITRMYADPTFDRAAVRRWRDDFYAPDVDYRAIEGAPDDRGPIHGGEEISDYLGEWVEMFENTRLETDEVVDAGGDMAIATLLFSGRDRRHGVDMTPLKFSILYTVRGDRVVRGREYLTKDEALAAAEVELSRAG